MSTGTPRPGKKDEEKIDQLLREGIAAAKLGDKATACTKLQAVVELDQYNEKGWYWLASVVETAEERRACLGNVIVINPDNKRAQELLAQLDDPEAARAARQAKAEAAAEAAVSANSRRRPLIIVIIGGVAALILLVLIVVASRVLAPPPPPQNLAEIVASQATGTAIAEATGGAYATQTALAITQPATSAPTSTLTATPTASTIPTRAGTLTGTPLAPPPAGLTGHLLILSGSGQTIPAKPNTPDNLLMPMFIIDPDGKNQKAIGTNNERGNFALLAPDEQRVIYTQYNFSLSTQQIRTINRNGTQGSDLSTLWNNQPPLSDQQMPSLARNGRWLVFSAINKAFGPGMDNDKAAAIYLLPVRFTNQPDEPTATFTRTPTFTFTPRGTRAPTIAVPTRTPGGTRPATQSPFPKVIRVTPKDNGINTWPALSADGKLVAYVRDSKPDEGTDVWVIPAQGGNPQNLTGDGNDVIEAAPEWSPDGKQIAFQAAEKGAKTNDIWVMDANGKNKKKLVEGGGDNIRPHWSPDGKYIAFSSTRSGKWEVFIVEAATGALFQVTQTPATTFCTAWGA